MTDAGDREDRPTNEREPRSAADHEPPPAAETHATWRGDAGASLPYTARGEWTVLRRREKPAAEIFSVAYVAEAAAAEHDGRPVTFVFNGGPGASSAYLHLGAVGPVRVAFPADGSLPRPPARLVDNEDSWLAFTDIVFVDPVGTGFSRVIEPPGGKDGGGGDGGSSGGGGGERARPDSDDDGPSRRYFGYKHDLESLCEFMGRWLSDHGRWGSAVLIAGESYGGYRVGRLARMLQETAGIGLSGAVLISPALEISSLLPTDYDVLGWLDALPTMALTAVHHGRSRAFAADARPEAVRAEAERFATGDYVTLLARGASMQTADRDCILRRLADLVGLPAELVARAEGRVAAVVFARELLRDERRVLGAYDATITTVDPFPDRAEFAGPDPTLSGFAPAFTTAINRQLRTEIGVRTDREYVLLSDEVNEAWRNDAIEHFFAPPVGATDDLRYGMTLNPHLRTFIAHGRYDLVTPYYSSDRLRNLMRLHPDMSARLVVRHFDGGHMFYAWERSRRELTAAIAAFVAEATGSAGAAGP